MTERRGDQGFSVAPSRVDGSGDGWRGRRRRLTIWLVLAAAVAVVVIAVLGPRLRERPSLDLSFLPTPTPRPSASPTLRPIATPAATPLPRLTRGDGPIPPGTIAVQTDAFRILDPTSGTVTDGLSLTYGQAALLRSADGSGWTCICLVDDLVDQVANRIVRVVDIDETGEPASFADVTVLGPAGTDPDRPPSTTAAVDITADGTVAILARAQRQSDETFVFSAAGLSLDDRRMSPFEPIGTESAPQASPTPGPSDPPEREVPRPRVHVDGPHVRVAPDGTMAFVWARLEQELNDGPALAQRVAWRLKLRPDGSVERVAEAPALAAMPPYCEYAGFATADRFALLCLTDPETAPAGSATWVVHLLALDGSAAGQIPLPESREPGRYLGEPLFDRSNAALYVWEPVGLTLIRVDVRRMSVERVVFDPAAEVASGVAAGGGSLRPDWHDADNPLYGFGYGEIAAAADGSRLYLVGFREENAPDAQYQASLGVFVVDRSTMALVDRWAPTANYQTLAMALDDQAVAASAFASTGADGRPAPWEASMTLHDPADGRVIAQFGRLGLGLAPIIVER